MYAFILRAILSGIISSSFGKWFLTTRVGVWFQDKLDHFMEYLSDKYNIHLIKQEAKWRQNFPILSDKIDELEKNSHPCKELHEFDVWPELNGRIIELEKKVKELENEQRNGD